MRVAFCIYGQVRDEHLSFPQIEAIARKNDAQIFMSVWKKRGTKLTGALETSQLSRIFGPEVGYTLPRIFFDRLFDAFPTLKTSLLQRFSTDVTLESVLSYMPEARAEIEEGGDIFAFTRIAFSDVNSLRMLYKMWRSYLMMKEHERRTGVRFDYVALFRPDVIPPEVIPALPPKTLGVVQFHHDFIHDMFMLGDAEAIDRVMDLFGKCVMNATRPWKGIHVELHDQAMESGLKPEIVAITAGITDSTETQAEGRRVLRHLLQTQSFDRAFRPEIKDWATLASILQQTIDLADHGMAEPAFDGAAAIVERDADGSTATEPAFSMIGFMAEAHARYDLAFLAETCRIAAAVGTDGSAALVKLREWMIPRWRHLASQAGRAPREQMQAYLDNPANGDAITSTLAGWLVAHFDAPMRRIFDDLVLDAGRMPPSIDEFYHVLMTSGLGTGRDAAEETVAIMLALYPRNWYALDRLGHFRSRTGEHAAAMDCAVRAMQLEGSGSWGFNARIGRIYADLGDLPNARRYLAAAANMPGGDEAKGWLEELVV